jgi:hypothetical protein
MRGPEGASVQQCTGATRQVGGAFAEVHEQVAGLLGGPRPGGVSGDAQGVHPPCADLHHEEHVQASEEDRVDVQEVAGEDSVRLGGQELPPGGRRAARGGCEPGRGQDPPYRSRADPVPEAEEFALDAPVSPPRVLPGQPPDQFADLLRDRRASDGVRVGPPVLD